VLHLILNRFIKIIFLDGTFIRNEEETLA